MAAIQRKWGTGTGALSEQIGVKSTEPSKGCFPRAESMEEIAVPSEPTAGREKSEVRRDQTSETVAL